MTRELAGSVSLKDEPPWTLGARGLGFRVLSGRFKGGI